MPNVRWQPKTQNLGQRDTITIAATWAAGDSVTLEINQKQLTLTVGTDATTAQVATALAQLINGEDQTGTGDHTFSATGDDIPAEFGEVEASAEGSVVTVESTEAGRPFTLTVAETTAGDGTATEATALAATSENHFDSADNWGGSAIPADLDAVYFDNTDVGVFFGLSQADIEPASVTIAQSFEGEIGLPEYSEEGGYHEYRPTYLRLGMAALTVGAGEGNGSGRIKIDSGDDVCAVTVLNTGAGNDNLPAFLWLGTHASNTLVVRGGSVGVAVFGGEVATLASVTVHDGDVTLGSGCTLSGAIVVNGGVLRINSKVDGSLTVTAGTVVIEGTADVDQLTIRGGVVVFNTNGTLGGATVISGSGVLDLSQDSRALAAVSAAIDLFGTESRLGDPFKRLGNASFDLNEGATVAQLDLGQNIRVSRAATA